MNLSARSRWLLLLVALLVPVPALAQDGGDPAPEGEKPAATPAGAPTAPEEQPEEQAETDEYLQAMTGEMMRQVEAIRGLPFKTEVERVWKSRDEARDEMLREIDEQTTPEELAAATRSMQFFNMLRPDQDLAKVFADFISAGAGGYYLPDKDVFSLVRGMGEVMGKPVVFHELVHAVEDQYYDFADRTKRYEEEKKGDASAALHALVEGSARTYENRYVDGVEGLRQRYMQAQMKESMKNMASMMKQPPALVIGMGIFPYNNGAAFIAEVVPALTESGEMDEVEAMASLFADPPASTEMILHPEKYLGDRDLPQTLLLADDLEAAFGEGWTILEDNTSGEFGLGLMLNACLVPSGFIMQIQSCIKIGAGGSEIVEFRGQTARAVNGWDGDRYAVLGHGDARTAGVMALTFDTETDAAEFAEVYGSVIERKYKDETPVEGAARWDATGGDGFSTAIVTEGRHVFIAEQVPGDRLDAILASLAKTSITQDEADALPAR